MRLRNSYALVGDPPGSPFSGPGTESPGGLNCPVLVDEDPGPRADRGGLSSAGRPGGGRLPVEPRRACCRPRTRSCGRRRRPTACTTAVGDAGGRPVTVGFTESDPALAGQRPVGCGPVGVPDHRPARPDRPVRPGRAGAVPGGPGRRRVVRGVPPDRAGPIVVAAGPRGRRWPPTRSTSGTCSTSWRRRSHRREEAAARAGGQRFAQLRDHQALPRVVCVIDNFPLLLAGSGPGGRRGAGPVGRAGPVGARRTASIWSWPVPVTWVSVRGPRPGTRCWGSSRCGWRSPVAVRC